MRLQRTDYLRFTTRALCLLFIGFTLLFALDAFTLHRDFPEIAGQVFSHLIPTLLLLTIFVLSLKREWIGAIAFLFIAVFYTISTLRHVDWILTIAGPLYVIGVLYGVVWYRRQHQQKKFKFNKN